MRALKRCSNTDVREKDTAREALYVLNRNTGYLNNIALFNK